ncbi:MAG: hypothetical protein E7313_03800 [Clostridiales bacterium]|nr:hypothetical protein [Clostridiales bacterium]
MMDKLYVIKGFYNNETVYYVSIENSSHSNLPIWKVTANIENATKYSNLDIAISNCKDLMCQIFKVYPVCPICNMDYLGHPAISRIDNSTEICPDCGMKEALFQFITKNT